MVEPLPPKIIGWAGDSVQGPLHHGGTHGDQRLAQHTISLGNTRDLQARPSRAGERPGLEKGDELDFSESSSEDDIRRRRVTVRAFTLDEIPAAS